MEIRVDFEELKTLERSMARAPEVVREELLRAMTEADLLVLREAQERTPHAAGTLRSSEYGVEKMGEFQVEGFVGSPLNYAQPVELGTRPHFPPVEALMDWVKLRFQTNSDREARAIAFLVARKISRVGTQGAGMFEKTLAAVEPQLLRIFQAASGRIAGRLTGAGTA